ncbi:hypothetical protein BH11PLA2_BH11PLA2_44430 [soil metagenome]
MKILCLAAHYPPYHAGGYGAVAHAFCEGLQQRGHFVAVLTRKPEGDAVGPEPKLPVLRSLATVQPGKSPWRLFANSRRNFLIVNDLLGDDDFDVVFSCGSDSMGFNTYRTAIYSSPSLTYLGDTWLAQAWRNLPAYDPYIDMARGGRKPGLGRFLKRCLGFLGCARFLRRSARPNTWGAVTVISQFVLDDLKASGAPVPNNVPFTYVPLDRSFFDTHGEPVGHDGPPSTPLRALFVSRMEPLKGPDVAIAGVAAAVKVGHDVTLTLAGMRIEDMRKELQMQAETLGIADRVTLAGTPSKAELLQHYRHHDVFLFPSRIVEGLGLVNCEAQACGLPIIGVADSGAAEVIHHGVTGFRIAKNDSDAMGRHLGELAKNRELWQTMSANALQSAKRFHPDTILDTLEAALLAVVR